jgi:hypothetical protein
MSELNDDEDIYGGMDIGCEECGTVTVLYHTWTDVTGDIWLCGSCLKKRNDKYYDKK